MAPAMPPDGMDYKALEMQCAQWGWWCQMAPTAINFARDMIGVHGREAATLARENAVPQCAPVMSDNRASVWLGHQGTLSVRCLGIDLVPGIPRFRSLCPKRDQERGFAEATR
jgi:hypothetical protein